MRKIASALIILLISCVNANATEQLLLNSSHQNPDATTTQYSAALGGVNSVGWDNTESVVQTLAPAAGSLTEMRVESIGGGSPGSGKSFTFTVRINGADSNLSCAVSDTGTTCNDTCGDCTLSAGDLVSIKSVPSGTPTSDEYAWTLLFDSTTSSHAILSGGIGNDTIAANDKVSLAGSVNADANEWNHQCIMAGSATIRNLYIETDTDPGSGNTWTFTVEKNGTSQSMTCNIAGDGLGSSSYSCNDTSNTFTVVSIDEIHLEVTNGGGTPTGGKLRTGVVYNSSTEGDFPFCSNYYTGTSNTATQYFAPHGYAEAGSDSGGDGGSETSNQQIIGKAITVKSISCKVNASIFGADTINSILRTNGTTDEALNCILNASSDTVGNDEQTDVSLSLDDLITTKVVPVGSPAYNEHHVGFMANLAPGEEAARRVFMVQ